MVTSLTATIDENGISVPDYAACLAYLQEQYRAIYGQDIYIEADSQDGQLIGIHALAESDAFSSAVATYNCFSPATAQGVGLSSVVKINGLERLEAAYSTVDVTLTGDTGTEILNGAVSSTSGQKWYLPSPTVITPGTSVTVTATAAQAGAVTAAIGTVTKIATPVAGWDAVTNPSAAVAGRAVETDAALRKRQSISTALPALTVLESIIAAVAQIDGVTRYSCVENDTGSADVNGVPAHSIALVVEGGDVDTIAQTIGKRKTPGTGTYGSTSVMVYDTYGIGRDIKFSRPTLKDIAVAITIKALTGYTSSIGVNIKASIAAYISSLDIGADVLYTRLYVPGQLAGPYGIYDTTSDSSTFEVQSITIGLVGGSTSAADIAIAFDEAAECAVGDITLTVV